MTVDKFKKLISHLLTLNVGQCNDFLANSTNFVEELEKHAANL
jgi:hypothetical protein